MHVDIEQVLAEVDKVCAHHIALLLGTLSPGGCRALCLMEYWGVDGTASQLQDADGRIDFDEFTAMMTAGNQEILSSKSTLRREQLAEKVVSMRPTRNSLS